MLDILFVIQKNNSFSETIASTEVSIISIWFWAALLEFIIIIFLIFKSQKKAKKLDFSNLSKDKIRNKKKSTIDMGNLMDSINGAKSLYKELSRSCHPDRFINSDKHKIAEEIFQNISKNERDFKKLSEIKKVAEVELNLKFKENE